MNATTTKNELYIHKITGATTVEIPFTASTLSTVSAPATNAGQWSYLPSGLLISSGSATGISGSVVITPFAGPGFTNILSVLVCPYGTGAGDLNFAVRVQAITATTFTVYVSSRTGSGAAVGGLQYLAIGY